MKTTVVALLLAMSMCGGESKEEVTEEGSDITSPLGALSALSGMAEEAGKLQEELESMDPVDPVHYNELMPALPEPPHGWTAGEAEGSSTQAMGGFSMSQVSRNYEQEGKSVHIEVGDWAFNKMIYMPFILSAQMSQESTKGYNKGITVGEDPGRDQYTIASKRGERLVLVSKRFPVTLKTRGLEPEEIDEWWKLINTAYLRGIAE